MKSRGCQPLIFFVLNFCFSSKINVHSYNSLSTFNVCMVAVAIEVCVNTSLGGMFCILRAPSRGLMRRKDKRRRANLSLWRHLGEKVRYGCQFALHVCVLRCERSECGRVRVCKLCLAFQHSVSVKPGVALLRLQTGAHSRCMCWICQSNIDM